MDVKCWTCGEPITDFSEADNYGEEIRHIECPDKTSKVMVYLDPLTRNVREGHATVVVSYDTDPGSDLVRCDVYFGKLNDGDPLVHRMVDRSQLIEAGLLTD